MKWKGLATMSGLLLLAGCGAQESTDRTADVRRVNALVDAAYETADLTSAMVQCRKAYQLARKVGNPSAEAYALNCLGRKEFEIPRFDAALRRYEEVLRIAESHRDERWAAVALLNQSQALIRLGLHEWAMERILRGLRQVEAMPPGTALRRRVHSSLLINQGVIARERGDYQASLELTLQAEALLEPEERQLRLSIEGIKAYLFHFLGQNAEALALLDAVREEVREAGSPGELADHESIRGVVLLAMGHEDAAIAAIEGALAHSRATGFPFQTAEILIDRGSALMSLGVTAEASESFMQALERAQRIGAPTLVADAHRKLTDFYRQQGDFRKAYEHLQASITIRQRQTAQESQRRVASLQALLEAEAVGKEMVVLQERERDQRRFNYVLVLVLLLLVLVAVQLFSRCRNEARLNRRIRSDHRKLQRLNERLMQASWREVGQLNRVATLGEMAAAFAHELRQPLTAIVTNAQAARRSLKSLPGPDSIVRGAVEDTVEAARRAEAIVRRLRRLMDQGVVDMKRCDLNEVVGEIEGLLQKNAEACQVRLVLEPAHEPLMIFGDQVQLQQVVLNLVQNGLAASQRDPVPERFVIVRTSRSNTTTASLEVVDSGPEISAEVFSRMFHPLFTTKEHGLGVGLALCRRIASAHDGSIAAARNPERGLTFRLTVLLANSTARVEKADQEVA